MKIKGGTFWGFLCVGLLLPHVVFALPAPTIAITEIGAYESSGAEWIEVYNYGTEPADLADFTFFEQEMNHRLSLFNSDDFLLAPEAFGIVAQDASSTIAAYPALANTKIFDSSWGSLKENGELIGLRDAEDNFIEQFIYLPAEDGSLERIDSRAADYSSANWVTRASRNSIGAATVIETTETETENEAPPPDPPPTATSTPEIAPEETTATSTPELLPETVATGTPAAAPETIVTSTPIISAPEESATIIKSYSAGTVVINEFVSDPADGAEWIELYNNFAMSVDSSGWTVRDGGGAITVLSSTLAAHEFFVIEKPKGALNNTGDLILLADNTGAVIDSVSYGNWQDGAREDNAPSARDPFSVARYQDGRDSNNDSLDFAITETATRGMPNVITNEETRKIPISVPIAVPAQLPLAVSSTPRNTIAPTGTVLQNDEQNGIGGPPQDFSELRIAEFLVDPDLAEEAEWIELWNEGEVDIDLEGVSLDDGDGGSRAYVIRKPTILPAGRRMIFQREKTRIALNNSGDSVRLFDPFNALLHDVQYAKAPKAQSYTMNEDGAWQWTKQTTPGMENVVSSNLPQTEPTTSHQDAVVPKQKSRTTTKKSVASNIINVTDIHYVELGGTFETTGVVSALPGILASQIMYISAPSTTGGVAVYSFHKQFPEISLGDIVQVRGVLSAAQGERRIRIKTANDMRVIGHADMRVPELVEIHELSEEYVGALIRVQGEVTQRLENKLYIDDDTGELLVHPKEKTNIRTEDITASSRVAITGILSATKNGFRLLPRNPKDITMVKDVARAKDETRAPETASRDYSAWILRALIVMAAVLASVLAAIITKNKFKKTTT